MIGLYMFIFIYIVVIVCVCVCVRMTLIQILIPGQNMKFLVSLNPLSP